MNSPFEKSPSEAKAEIEKEVQSDDDTYSLSDDQTFVESNPEVGQSLGDLNTMDGGSGDSNQKDPGEFGMRIEELEDRYKIEGALGKGGMGQVMLAYDTRLERKVAIKRIITRSAKSEQAFKRFFNGAKSLANLSHPNIVRVYDFGMASDGPFMIMEYMKGASLLERCELGKIPVADAINIACQICDGLSKSHAAGVIHRDIKPANILICEDGHPKLNDFDLATISQHDSSMTIQGTILGTLDYMPPEQKQDIALVDERSDLWSLTATLYQMVTGKTPKVISLDDVPDSLKSVFKKGFEEEKKNRFQTAGELKHALIASNDPGWAQESGEILRCPNCGNENSAERRYCKNLNCGTFLKTLLEGDCPHCGKVNPRDRRFCRHPDCGKSLEVNCLSCSVQMPMGEQVCDTCGAIQVELVIELQNGAKSIKQAAINQLKKNNFDDAKKTAEKLNRETDLRLSEYKFWARGFLTQIESRKSIALKDAGQAMHEARQHYQVFDYDSALRSLVRIPMPLRKMRIPEEKGTVVDLQTTIRERFLQAKQLNEEIKRSVADQLFDGLLGKVLELQKMQPPREDLKKLRKSLEVRLQKLKTIKQEALDEATLCLANQNYNKCIQALNRIDPSLVNDEVRELFSEAERFEARLDELQEKINTLIAVGEPYNAIPFVEEFLKTDRNAKNMHDLFEDLTAKETVLLEKKAQHFGDAKQAFENQQYDACLRFLENIEDRLIDNTIIALRKEAEGFEARLVGLREKINTLIADGEPYNAIPFVEEYLKTDRNAKDIHDLFEDLTARETELLEKKAQHFGDAKQAFENQQYDACLRFLENIEDRLIDNTITALRKEAEKLKGRVGELRNVVERSAAEERFADVLVAAEEYLSISPLPLDMQEYHKEALSLKGVFEVSASQAQTFYDEFKYSACVIEISKIQHSFLTDDLKLLLEAASRKKERVNILRGAIRERVKKEELIDLLPMVMDCLELNPNSQDMLNLKTQLTERNKRLKNSLSGTVEKVSFFRHRAQFKSAVTGLLGVPKNHMTRESTDLLQECQYLLTYQEQVNASMRAAETVGPKDKPLKVLNQVLKKSSAYLAEIEKRGYTDTSTEEKVAEIREVKERFVKRREKKIFFWVSFILFVLLFLSLAAANFDSGNIFDLKKALNWFMKLWS
ncbi:MAG: protein kinase [Mariniblastus sp.]|nr:protein kinase [Mariniblastus sp.]